MENEKNYKMEIISGKRYPLRHETGWYETKSEKEEGQSIPFRSHQF